LEQAIAQVFHNAETIVHYRGADLQGAGAEQQKFRCIAPGGNTSIPEIGSLEPPTTESFPSAAAIISAMGFTAGPA